MADEFSIEVEGIEECCRLLDKAPAEIATRTFSRALIAACVPVVRALNTNTPERTGDLADHIKTGIEVWTDGTGGRACIGFGKEGWKARLVEYGHRAIGHRPDKKQLAIGRVPAHPFMRESLEQSAGDAVKAFTDSVRDQLGPETQSKVA